MTTPTIYVLGLGNVLMGDDGVGPAVVRAFEAEYIVPPDVEVVDLGTLQSELEGLPVGEERTKNVHAQRDIKKWLAKQLRVMERKFAPFLTLGH